MSDMSEDPALTDNASEGTGGAGAGDPEYAATGVAGESFRSELTVKQLDVVDEGWAGSIPAQYGVAPRVRVTRDRWFNLLWLIPIGFLFLILAVAIARGTRDLPAVQAFIVQYPGTSELPMNAPVGFPPWLAWQHFFNLFLMIFHPPFRLADTC